MLTHDLLGIAAACVVPTYDPPAVIMNRGEGCRVWDLEGRQYLDFAAGIGVNILGHNHPQVTAAIADQSAQLCHTSNAFWHAPGIALSSRLAKLGHLDQVFLCNSGTEAVEAALKLCRRFFADQNAPRTGFVAAHKGFHGRTYGALSVTGQPAYGAGFGPLVPGVAFVPYNDIAAMAAAIDEHTAGVVIEPIQGNGGVVVPDAGYLPAVYELCQKRGALLVLDEVQTGMGRTGRWFAADHQNVRPDIVCLAKALGGGLPLGAMLASRGLAACLQPGTHGSTFGGNPVACAAALATLDVIERDNLLQRAQDLGNSYRQMLEGLALHCPRIRDVRGKGLLVGLALDEPAKPWARRCMQKGLLLTTAGSQVLRLFPPMTATLDDLQQSVEILQTALS